MNLFINDCYEEIQKQLNISQPSKSHSFILGRAFRKFDKFVLLSVINLLVKLQFFIEVVVPFLLHFIIQSVLCFIIVESL